MAEITPFVGAKMALYLGRDLAVLLRDDLPNLPFRGMWDFPGGGREGDEDAFECVRRECLEELGLGVTREDLLWEYRFVEGGQEKWFFVAALPADASDRVVFGNEGQRWELMPEGAFMAHDKAVPFLQERLGWWLKRRSSRKDPPLP